MEPDAWFWSDQWHNNTHQRHHLGSKSNLWHPKVRCILDIIYAIKTKFWLYFCGYLFFFFQYKHVLQKSGTENWIVLEERISWRWSKQGRREYLAANSFWLGDCRVVLEGRQRVKRRRPNPNSICCAICWYAFFLVFLSDFEVGFSERNGDNAQDFTKDITLTVRDLTDSNDPSQLYQYTDGMKNRDS